MTTLVDRAAIRALAAQHIQDLGLDQPPFDNQASLEARQLTLLPDPLEEILTHSPLSLEEREKIDGFIHLDERILCLRGNLHPHQHRNGVLHEVAHDIIPWQRDLLYYCPIFSLSEDLQQSFEREANVFAAECSFFAGRFIEEAVNCPNHLSTAVTLAGVYGTSFEATFRHYVECHPAACLLLVSRLVSSDNGAAGALWETRQFILSATATTRPRIKQRFSLPELTALLDPNVISDGIIEHEVAVAKPSGKRPRAAQSFWNTYKLFTLIWL